MKNKHLSVLLSVLLLQPGINGLAESEKITLDEHLDKYFQDMRNKHEIQKQEIDEKMKELDNKSKVGLGLRLEITSPVILTLMAAYAGVWFIRLFKNGYKKYAKGDAAIREIISKYDKLRNPKLTYNQRFKEFMDITSKIIIECNKNDNGESTTLDRAIEETKDSFNKSQLEAEKTPFELIYNRSSLVSDDYTIVFGYIARDLGLNCYPMYLSNVDDHLCYSVLLLAKAREEGNKDNPWIWGILDGRGYSDNKKDNLLNADGLLDFDQLDKTHHGKYKGHNKYIARELLSDRADRGSIRYLLKVTDDKLKSLKEGKDLNFYEKLATFYCNKIVKN